MKFMPTDENQWAFITLTKEIADGILKALIGRETQVFYEIRK
jgi:hypothetical protein